MICCIVICLILSLTYSHFPTDVSFPLRNAISHLISWKLWHDRIAAELGPASFMAENDKAAEDLFL